MARKVFLVFVIKWEHGEMVKNDRLILAAIGIFVVLVASTLARPHRPFLERKVAGPSPSASCRACSADGRSEPTGIETVFRQPDSRFRPSVGTSEPRARLQRPLPSRTTRTWMHPALQDESHPAAADLYILFIFYIFP